MRGIAHPAVVARGLLEATAAITYLVALAYIPFAIATAVGLSTPLFLAVLAVLILKEQVGWRRWSAITAGFVGVIMVIQPQPGDINGWTWLVLVSSLVGALRDVFARYVPPAVPSLVVSLSSAVTVGLVGCVATQNGWQPMPLRGVAYPRPLAPPGDRLPAADDRATPRAEFRCGSFRYASVLGDRHRLRGVGRRAQWLAFRHCRRRGLRPLHPPS
jgi:hypothetical protein